MPSKPEPLARKLRQVVSLDGKRTTPIGGFLKASSPR